MRRIFKFTFTPGELIAALEVTAQGERISEIRALHSTAGVRLLKSVPNASGDILTLRAGESPAAIPAAAAALRRFLDCYERRDLPGLRRELKALRPALHLPPEVSSFSAALYSELFELPFGQSVSYQELYLKATARQGRVPDMQSALGARAAGQAAARNKLLIVVPCHRVLRQDGSLGGYAGGLPLKRWLLTHEGIAFKE